MLPHCREDAGSTGFGHLDRPWAPALVIVLVAASASASGVSRIKDIVRV
jgi:hypothetical protein